LKGWRGGGREGAAAGGETPTKGPDPQGPTLAWPRAAAPSPLAAAICGSVSPRRQRPRARHVPICHLPGSELRLRRSVGTAGCGQHPSLRPWAAGCEAELGPASPPAPPRAALQSPRLGKLRQEPSLQLGKLRQEQAVARPGSEHAAQG